MLETIYWIIATVVMILFLIGAISNIRTDKQIRRYWKKQEILLNKEIMDSLIGDLDNLFDKLKNESEDK